ncbi:sensor histidine kinase [Sneathiella limimaris]|uniref:sensor histidine kinase n=1 Tax=Sneathiella limimaris TaxID=1964213 RepID=UPI00146F3F3C|nr:HAMP domain-containing sensor histidine kinase [Sneathiella limimaris]
MDEVRFIINSVWALLFLSITLYFIRKSKWFPSTDRGMPILIMGFTALTIGSVVAIICVTPALFNGHFTLEQLANYYIIADVIRAIGVLIIINGIIMWSRALLTQYQLVKEKQELENRVSKQSDLLASQSRDLEIRTIDYLEQKDATIEAEKSKTNFLRNTSHEFRTPLNAIIGLSDLLMEGKVSSREEQREFARMISDSGRKLLKIIDTLLDIARIKSGEYIANSKPGVLREVIDQCVSLHLPKAHAKSIQFRHIPENDEKIMAFFDANATHHILSKLIVNAITFSPRETTITIKIDQEQSDYIRVIVTDQGPGIPQEHLKSVFEIFNRAERWQHRGNEGTGLGLALSLKMAQIQDGLLEIQSDGETGTTCILSLPSCESALQKTA